MATVQILHREVVFGALAVPRESGKLWPCFATRCALYQKFHEAPPSPWPLGRIEPVSRTSFVRPNTNGADRTYAYEGLGDANPGTGKSRLST